MCNSTGVFRKQGHPQIDPWAYTREVCPQISHWTYNSFNFHKTSVLKILYCISNKTYKFVFNNVFNSVMLKMESCTFAISRIIVLYNINHIDYYIIIELSGSNLNRKSRNIDR